MNYSVQQGFEPINWQFLCENTEVFTIYQLQNFCENSRDWKRCAVGQLTHYIPRDSDGVPKSYYLRNLGKKFWLNFESGNYSQCLVLLSVIRDHEKIIMQHINRKAKIKKRRKENRKRFFRSFCFWLKK